nr:PREDICTED: tigger transposable element-derived protein 1-like [Megachile rotundata]
MDEMERSLSSWIDDQHQNNVPLSFSIIQAKALTSNGWFEKFKVRYSLHNIKFTGESADADKNAAKEFISLLSKIIEDGEYSRSQIFNVDETGLFWKKMSNRTFLLKGESVAPGHKPSKNQLTLLLGGNLAGDLTNEIFILMNQLQLDVNKDDVDELIESHSAPLSNEYLIEQQLTFTHLDKFLSIMEECDPNGERIYQVRRAIKKGIACYKNLYQEKKKMGGIQLTLYKIIKEAPERT